MDFLGSSEFVAALLGAAVGAFFSTLGGLLVHVWIENLKIRSQLLVLERQVLSAAGALRAPSNLSLAKDRLRSFTNFVEAAPNDWAARYPAIAESVLLAKLIADGAILQSDGSPGTNRELLAEFLEELHKNIVAETRQFEWWRMIPT